MEPHRNMQNQAGQSVHIPLMENARNMAHEGAAAVMQAADRLHALADRLIGQLPTPISDPRVSTPPAPEPPHAIGRIGDAHRFLNVANDRLREAVDRLEAL